MTLQDIFEYVREWLFVIWTTDLLDFAIVLLLVVVSLLMIKFVNYLDRISGNR